MASAPALTAARACAHPPAGASTSGGRERLGSGGDDAASDGVPWRREERRRQGWEVRGTDGVERVTRRQSGPRLAL